MIKILEYIWLFMSLLGASGTALKIKNGETSEVGFFIILTFIAVIMFLYRRRQRITLDRARAEDTSDKYH